MSSAARDGSDITDDAEDAIVVYIINSTHNLASSWGMPPIRRLCVCVCLSVCVTGREYTLSRSETPKRNLAHSASPVRSLYHMDAKGLCLSS